MTIIQRKHPPTALVIQQMESKSCRVCISINSCYTSIKAKYGNDVKQYKGLSIVSAHKLVTSLRQEHSDLHAYPIWLQCRRNEWVDVTDENSILLYILSGD